MSIKNQKHRNLSVSRTLGSSRPWVVIGKQLTVVLFFAFLIIGGSLVNAAPPTHLKEIDKQDSNGKVSVSNGVVTVVVTAGGGNPTFYWYANNNNNSYSFSNNNNNLVNKVQYKGIVEYLDYGQKIYQRKYEADLQQQINNMTKQLKPINDSDVESNATVFGTIQVNRVKSTQQLFNYVVVTRGQQIGVNITNSTGVIGELRGEVIVKGLVKKSSDSFYIVANMVAQMSGLEKEYGKMHPAFFEFNQGQWNFTGFEPIKSGDKTIGYQFSFILQKIRNPHFNNLEDQIEIRSRIYNSTVMEGNLTVTSASVKSDVIIKSWRWNLNSVLANVIGLDPSKDKLALWLDISTFNAKLDDVLADKSHSILSEVKSDHESINAKHAGADEGEDEKELKVSGREGKLTFVTDNTTLGGYFNFTSSAYTYQKNNPAVNQTVPVTASYLSNRNSLRLFLVYPYFGNKTLEHDPTLGVETQDVSTTPQYKVNVASASAALIVPTQSTTSKTSTSSATSISTTTSSVTTSSSLSSTKSETTSATSTSAQTSTTQQPAAIDYMTIVSVVGLVAAVAVLGIFAMRRRGPKV